MVIHQEEPHVGVGHALATGQTPSPVDVRQDRVEISDRLQCVLRGVVLRPTHTFLTARDIEVIFCDGPGTRPDSALAKDSGHLPKWSARQMSSEVGQSIPRVSEDSPAPPP